MADRALCLAPWLHLHAHADGAITPCCLWPHHLKLGQVGDKSLQDVWNGTGMRELRLHMLEGKESEGCARCYRLEEAGFLSMRQELFEKYPHLAQKPRETSPDGASPTEHVVSLDLRISNLCNFRCRGCNAFLSSSWHEDQVTLQGAQPGHKRHLNIAKDAPDFWDEVMKLIPQLEEVYFAGGEPLLMPEHPELLRQLLAQGRRDVRLVYNTNLSTLEHDRGGYGALWDKFQDVRLGVSVDDMGARAEYFRHGTKWERLVRHLEILRERHPHVRREVFCTVSLFNVYYLPELMEWLVDGGHIRPDAFDVNLLTAPAHLSVQVLPATLKTKITEKLLAHASLWSVSHGARWTRLTKGLQLVAQHMNAEDGTHLLPTTVAEIRALDRMRGESFAATYPEIRELENFST